MSQRYSRFLPGYYQLRAVVLLCGVSYIALASAADQGSEFAAAKQSFLKEMKKRSAPARVDAVNALAKIPQAETVDLLIKRGLIDEDASVQQAARKGLRTVAQEPAAAGAISDELKRSIKKINNEQLLATLVAALATSTDRQMQSDLLKTLDDFLASPKANLLVPMTAIDELGLQGGPEALQGVSLLSRCKTFESHFGYRRCVVQAMSQLRERGAISFLIDLLPNTQGLIQHDVVQYLTKTTKQKFRDNDRDWKLWWKQNEAKFEFPPPGAANPQEDVADDTQATYYGIPICAKRIVFVLDTSRSMQGQPMEAAKNALVKTVDSLPEAVNFDIIMFDRVASTWLPRLVPATYQAKQQATQTVMNRAMSLGTASHAALNAAFNLEPEVIYFLSDGEPTDGQPSQIVANISQLNRTRRVSIHTIGVVTQRGGGAGLTLFMQPLSQQNYGTFRLIE